MVLAPAPSATWLAWACSISSPPTPTRPRALNRHFRQLFLLMELFHRYGFNPWVFDRLFGRGARGQPLLDRLIRVCFGAAPPGTMLDPLELGALLFSRPMNHREQIG